MRRAHLIVMPLLMATLNLMPTLGFAEQALPAKAIPIEVKTISADAVIRDFYAQLLDVMKQGDKLGFSGRYKKLEPVIHAAFNMPLMTRLVVGSAWENATSEQQQQLISAFSDFSVANYASQFKAYDGEEFTVVDTKPAIGGALVETKLQPKDGDPVTLDYLMRQDEHGGWRVIDVFLNGTISQLAARRSDFGSIAKRDGISALVNSLGEKARQMGPS